MEIGSFASKKYHSAREPAADVAGIARISAARLRPSAVGKAPNAVVPGAELVGGGAAPKRPPSGGAYGRGASAFSRRVSGIRNCGSVLHTYPPGARLQIAKAVPRPTQAGSRYGVRLNGVSVFLGDFFWVFKILTSFHFCPSGRPPTARPAQPNLATPWPSWGGFRSKSGCRASGGASSSLRWSGSAAT